MIGRIYYQIKTRARHGPRVAYFRDVVRPRILQTAPVDQTNDLRCEIHVLTSKDDFLNLIWALKSFYRASKRRYALCIHDDGSLTAEIRATLSHHFPAARLIERSKSDGEARERLKNHPRCLDFRLNNHLAPKIFDFPAHLQSERMLLLDSDVLFFAAPTALLERIEDLQYRFNCVNRDVSDASTVDATTVKNQTGVQSIERFNSGLGLIFGDSLRLDWIEEFLSLPGILDHFWRIEQTLYMLCSARYGGELLPPSYDVHLGIGNSAQSRHYVGAVRHLMYGEGIARLVKNGFLKDKNGG
jgi:hypothetical protein